jgi:hypothetical protein
MAADARDLFEIMVSSNISDRLIFDLLDSICCAADMAEYIPSSVSAALAPLLCSNAPAVLGAIRKIFATFATKVDALSRNQPGTSPPPALLNRWHSQL